ncbi:hypothetical protein AN936_23900 (plasmid) [Sphingopyxis macrogoltabida]|uniref:Uncharacterized protein n=1 Tax=Sphingopyxis macrogoltabida TaxID=33050 RepID=A0A0N9V617_SPHMC|nr:hypothetical protein AN936_23900 [Sphingopyxis macrogoltabida]
MAHGHSRNYTTLTDATEVAEAEDFHVDAATKGELEVSSQVSLITLNASVWRGDDEEVIASAMDHEDHVGRVWIFFRRGEDQDRSARFRETLVEHIKKVWPASASLPVMPSGTIPLARDLVLTPSGYEVKASEASNYQQAEP